MFLKTRYAGYNRHDEQVAAGYFLMLLQPKPDSLKYHPYEVNCACGKTREQHEEEEKTRVHDCSTHGIYARLRALSELKGTDGYEDKREEVKDLWEKNKHDRHVAGCPECDAHKAYYSECRAFTVKHIHYPLRAGTLRAAEAAWTLHDGHRARWEAQPDALRFLRQRRPADECP